MIKSARGVKMIDLENSKREFLKYTKKYDLNEPEIKRKQEHSIRVMEISKQLAKIIFEKEEKIQIATLIGLLHDIARFEQHTKYKTFRDSESIDHGDYGVEILKENNYIRKYIETNQYDDIILKAIKSHNKFEIEEGLSEEEITYAKIIRDADKLDIFYEAIDMFWGKDRETIQKEFIEPNVKKEFNNKKTIDKRKIKSNEKIDHVVNIISFIYDINYIESFKIIKENNYIDKIINQFNFENEETKRDFEEIRKKAKDYIDEKIKKG